jgi:hypothetical protein
MGEAEASEGDREVEAPRDEVELLLVQIWKEVLGVERVGIHDNFFDLGGDSISGIQIILRANQSRLQLTPKNLFEHPTVAGLAAAARANPAIQGLPNSMTGDIAAESSVAGGPAPSAFPRVKLDHQQLDTILMKFNKARTK